MPLSKGPVSRIGNVRAAVSDSRVVVSGITGRPFRLALALTGVFMVLLAVTPVDVEAADDPEQVALAFVRASGAGNNLKQLSFASAQQTMTYRMVVLKKGEPEARHMLAEQVPATAPLYQNRWDRNLADAYLLHCTPEQLASVTKYRQASPFFEAVKSQQSAAGVDMQETSTKLLTDMVAAVLLAMFKQITPPQP